MPQKIRMGTAGTGAHEQVLPVGADNVFRCLRCLSALEALKHAEEARLRPLDIFTSCSTEPSNSPGSQPPLRRWRPPLCCPHEEEVLCLKLETVNFTDMIHSSTIVHHYSIFSLAGIGCELGYARLEDVYAALRRLQS